MSPPTTVAIRRSRALMIVRIASLALFILGGIPMCYSIGLAMVMRDVEALATMWNDTNWTAWGAAFLVPALILFFCDRRIVRWLIPVPRRECHECGYPLRGLSPSTMRCPECGTSIATTPTDQHGMRK